jgi:hypothetical protein
VSCALQAELDAAELHLQMLNQELHGAAHQARAEGSEGGPLTARKFKAERDAATALQQIHGVVAKIRGVCEQSVVSLTAIKDEQLRLANEKQVRARDREVPCL